VKYDTPILVSKAFNKSKPANGGSSINSQKTSASSSRSKEDPASKAEDYLNSILPPREYQDAGQLWVQYVSPTPATRIDVINL
jgi:dynein light intermediate chain, axonemal